MGQCSNCRNESSNLTKIGGLGLCEDCVRKYTFVCSICGKIHFISNRIIVDGVSVCDNCATEAIRTCAWCGHIHLVSGMTHSCGEYICSSCIRQAFTCERCGRLIHESDVCVHNDTVYCYGCYEAYANRGRLHDYSFKPSPVFYATEEEKSHGSVKRFFGVELEVDQGRDQHEMAACLQDLDEIFCKRDGSLGSGGVEIVTHPCTIGYHNNNMKWLDIIKWCEEKGYASHDTNSCGLHVHISRTAFGDSTSTQEANLAKLVYLFEKHWSKIIDFSRRTSGSAERWANRYRIDYESTSIDEGFKYAKRANSGSRYLAVNMQNRNTVEIRIFKGTLNPVTLLATIQFCDVMTECALKPLEEVRNLTWADIQVVGSKYKQLAEYFDNLAAGRRK